MILRGLALTLLLAISTQGTLGAQESRLVQEMRRSYDDFQLDSVLARGRRATQASGLSRSDLVAAFELMAYAYGALDSSAQAVDAFRELIRLDPDREPDVMRVAPRITSLYASALGQVLVLRRLRADSTSFVAGTGFLTVRFQVSRPARVRARIVGPGLDTLLDSLTVGGEGLVAWRALGGNGVPVAAGRYRVLMEAASGRDSYEAVLPVDVVRGGIDTLPHLTALEGYQERPETEQPPRSWGPLALTALYVGLAAGGTMALENSSLRGGVRTGLVGVSAAGILSGVAISLRRPEPRPVEVNALFNRLVREQLARRNAEIARTNDERRRQIVLTIVPAHPGAR